MDALSDIVQLLRPRTILLGEMAATGRWGLRMPPQPGPVFYLMLQGRCWYLPDGAAPVPIEEGDYMLSLRPDGDTFVSEPGAGIVLTDDAYKTSHKVDGTLHLGEGAGPPTARKLGGLILCNPANAELLLDLLPRTMILKATDDASPRLRALLSLIGEEAGHARQGRAAILSRLIEVLLVETLRSGQRSWSQDAGVVRGLADPQIGGALTHIHAELGRDWTVGELARRVGMSRSVFARQFSAKVGASPVEYLLNWRMAVAKDALLQRDRPLEEIAATVGYKSASAFSAAFARRVGCPPSEFARNPGEPRGGDAARSGWRDRAANA